MSSQGNPGPAPDEFSWGPREAEDCDHRRFNPNCGICIRLMRQPVEKSSSAATAGMVLGIVGLFCWPVGVVALLCGIQGRADVTRRGMTGNGQAVAGIIMGAISTLAALVSLVVFLLGLLP